jgi:hypothetical protein
MDMGIIAPLKKQDKFLLIKKLLDFYDVAPGAQKPQRQASRQTSA